MSWLKNSTISFGTGVGLIFTADPHLALAGLAAIALLIVGFSAGKLV